VCRSEMSANQLDRYRGVPSPLPSNPFDLLLALARVGVWTPSLFKFGDATEVLGGLVRHYQSKGVTPLNVATDWRITAGKLAKVTSTRAAWVFPVGYAGESLVLAATSWELAGPMRVTFGPSCVPVANGRDMHRVQRKPSYGPPIAGSDYASYTLRWRPVGRTSADLGLLSYRDLIHPQVMTG
jgi:hypothetical protein